MEVGTAFLGGFLLNNSRNYHIYSVLDLILLILISKYRDYFYTNTIIIEISRLTEHT